MKKFWLFILGLFSLLFAWNPTRANNEYEYTNLDITANILNDGTINFEEEFTTNFFVSKHWIIRDIPLNYSVWWKDFHIEVSNINVQWKNFTTSRNNWNIEIKIWDADRTVIWEQNYPISYSTYGLIRNFSGMWYAELYWNLVGYQFDTNINKVRAEIILPKTYTWFTKDDFLITTDWTAKTIDGFEWSVDWSRWDKIIITYDKWLSAFQWITLAVKFPNDYFQFNHKKQSELIWHSGLDFETNPFNIIDFWIRKVIIALFLISLIISFCKKNPKEKESHMEKVLNSENPFTKYTEINNSEIDDSKIKESIIKKELNNENPIVVRYEPPEWINCAEAGMLYNAILEPTDLTSLVYKRTIEWLISIQIDNDTWFSTVRRFIMTKLKDIDEKCPQYEKDFFNALLPGDINSKKAISTTSDFDIVWPLKSLRNYWESKWWIIVWGFSLKIFNFKNLKNISFWFIIFLIVFWASFFKWISVKVALIISAIFGLVWMFTPTSSNYPTQKKIHLTSEWEEIASEVIWYAQFIQMCDENKLRLFLKQDPTFFDKTLPYAVAFWFETQFIKKITPILEELDMRPSRYGWNINEIDYIARVVRDMIRSQEFRREKEKLSSYDSSSWFSSWSSFWGGFSSGWGGWWWGWRSR